MPKLGCRAKERERESHGIDYFEIFLSVIRRSTIRMFIALAVHLDLQIYLL
jgi:hypothetical protein